MQDYLIHDINQAADGQRQIDWVARWMKVVNQLAERFQQDGAFQGKRIGICIHLEAKTAYLALTLQRLGAEVWITSSNPLSAKDEVCAALAKNGVHVFARHGASIEEYWSFVDTIAQGTTACRRRRWRGFM